MVDEYDPTAEIEPPSLDADALETALHRRPGAPASATAFVLTVVEGPDTGKSVTLDAQQPQRVLIGQSHLCDVRLSDPSVSRRHAALEVTGARVRLTDLDSTNGTEVNGLLVSDALLRGGETLRLGASALRIEAQTVPTVEVSSAVASHFEHVMGGSSAMRRLYPLCARLAASDVSVVIEGETGTGKEVLAEALHDASARASKPFVVFDCTAIPTNLMESELFGHERGAFTGATTARKGVFEQADGGTLLIDEIGDLDATLQPKLLRATERHEIRRLGGDRVIRVDVRVLAATRRDLDHEVHAGRFRDDLFHRLAVARIELPPLRRRQGDVALLARHFCEQLGGDPRSLPSELLARWDDAPWPGNVRELRNAVARWLALGEVDTPSTAAKRADDGPPSEAPPAVGDPFERILQLNLPLPKARQRLVDEFESRYLERVLGAHEGSVARAAAASGIGRRYFQMLLARRA